VRRAGTVELWCVVPEAVDDTELLERYTRLLSAEERQRHARFAFARDRHRFLVSRALLRSVLSHYAPVEPSDWVFRAGPFGKPELAGPGPAPVKFNLSHTRGLAVCAVARGAQLGVDAERIDPARARLELARRYFAPQETALLEGADETRRAELFFRLWTLKEAFLKARGTGLAAGLDAFAIELSDQARPQLRLRRPLAHQGSDEPACWQLGELHLARQHQVGVALGAASDAGLKIVLRWSVPLQQADPRQTLPPNACQRWVL